MDVGVERRCAKNAFRLAANSCRQNKAMGENAKYAKLHSQNGRSNLPIMRVIARRTLREFWEKCPDAKDALDAWYDDAERATWKTPADIRAGYYGNPTDS